jgi:hypothetical protein
MGSQFWLALFSTVAIRAMSVSRDAPRTNVTRRFRTNRDLHLAAGADDRGADAGGGWTDAEVLKRSDMGKILCDAWRTERSIPCSFNALRDVAEMAWKWSSVRSEQVHQSSTSYRSWFLRLGGKLPRSFARTASDCVRLLLSPRLYRLIIICNFVVSRTLRSHSARRISFGSVRSARSTAGSVATRAVSRMAHAGSAIISASVAFTW